MSNRKRSVIDEPQSSQEHSSQEIVSFTTNINKSSKKQKTKSKEKQGSKKNEREHAVSQII